MAIAGWFKLRQLCLPDRRIQCPDSREICSSRSVLSESTVEVVQILQIGVEVGTVLLMSTSSATHLKARKRSDYIYFLSYRTRWSDNDQYAHVNNSIYYHLFDSIVNSYLIMHCGLEPSTSSRIGLVVSSFCQFFAPLSFPQVLDLGLRVNKLGSSSVTYEIGVFEEGNDSPASVGGYTHVFVDNVSRKSTAIPRDLRDGLSKLISVLETTSKL